VLLSSSSIGCGIRDDEGARILLFNGTGTSPDDVAAIETVLKASHLGYSEANSWHLNQMDETEISKYRLLIVPGGNFVKIGNGLTSSATANIRNAVQNGLSYLGLCAGAFFAGNSPYNGLNLTSGVRFGFYALEAQGIRKTAVAISAVGAQALEQYWEDGPELSGWGKVVGKYPDGTPAVVEGMSGKGCVVLCGVHPEAPASWRRGLTFTTSVSEDNAYAGTLIRTALNRASLLHY
jgi:glutamine amidotransferase-like uncharacterized protein